jgi:glutaredoxin
MTTRQVKRASDLHPKAAGPKPQAVIWSPMGDDRDTKLSVKLLTNKGAEVTVKNLDNNADLKTQFTTAYPTQKTLPYIVIDNIAVGGFKELCANSTYSMKAAPKAAAPVVKPTKFGLGSGVTPIASGTTVRNSVAAPKKKK